MLIEEGLNSEDFEMNVAVNKSLRFGPTDEITKAGLEKIAEAYLRLGIITSMDNLEDVMEKAWMPAAPEK